MSTTPQFDVAKAALEHLELLNCSNQNPLEIAAQFRTLLRSKKPSKNVHSTNIDYTYMDYITADATIRRRRRPRSIADYRSRTVGVIQYNQSPPELNSYDNFSKCQDVNNSIEDISPDYSAVSSDSSDVTPPKYPTINWKQLREKSYENKLDKVKQFISTKFKAIRSPRKENKDLILSNYSDVSEEIISNRSRSSSNSIRTPSISPTNSPRPTYTISRLNSTSMHQNNDDILFPIADCNLVIKHKPKRISHLENKLI